MRHLQNLPLFACLFLLALIPLSAKAFPPPSPAGGNYLVLDGVDDYAVLDFEIFDVLLPKGTDKFTVEAWVYPTALPDRNVHAMILSQQVRINVVSHDHAGWEDIRNNINWQKGDVFIIIEGHLAHGGGRAITPFSPIALSPNQWHHIAFQSNGKETTTIVNDIVSILRSGTTLAHDLSKFEHPKDFTLGGFGEKIRFHTGHFWGHFSGYIDEVRISTVARYDVGKGGFTPRTKFKNDAKTVALWHFDEPDGTRKFSDVSGNAHHLVGKNGAQTVVGKNGAQPGVALAVEARGKLATIWGRLKE